MLVSTFDHGLADARVSKGRRPLSAATPLRQVAIDWVLYDDAEELAVCMLAYSPTRSRATRPRGALAVGEDAGLPLGSVGSNKRANE
jgi:hypothetical protein